MKYGRSGMRFWIATAFALGALALVAGPAGATGNQVAPGQKPMVVPPGSTVIVKGPSKVVVQSPAPNHWNQRAQWPSALRSHGPCYPFGCDYRGPSYPFGNNYAKAPIAVAPRHTRRWVGPHWGQQWVPQYYVYQVWVPGYYSDQGWVHGYYEDRTAESGGYYQ